MVKFPANDYQKQLIVASLDDFTPNAALPNFSGGQHGTNPKIWRRAVVEFLCVNLRCGLIEVTHRPEISKRRDVQLLKIILTQGDTERDLSADIIWDVLYFNGTRLLSVMLEDMNMSTWDALSAPPNSRLTAELYRLYGTGSAAE